MNTDGQGNAKDCYAKGNKHFEQGELEKAVENYNIVIEMDPLFEKAYYNRALAYCHLKMYSIGMRDIDRYLELNQKNADAYYVKGLALEYLNKDIEATCEYLNALRLNPDHSDARSRMSYLWSGKSGKVDESLKDFSLRSCSEKVTGRRHIDIFYEETENDKSKAIITENKAEDRDLSAVALTPEVKEYITRVKEIITHTELAKECKLRRPLGVILEGPNGTGKTQLAFSLAGELGWNIVTLSFSKMASKWLAQTDRNISDAFRLLRNGDMKPAIVLFDEVDSMVRSKDSESRGHEVTMVNTIITEINNLTADNDAEGLFIVGTTNHLSLIDPSIIRRGRLDHLTVPLPPLETREEIFRIHFRDKPLAGDVDFSALASRTEGKSGADIAGYADDASFRLFQKRVRNQRGRKITMKMLDEIVRVPEEGESPNGYA